MKYDYEITEPIIATEGIGDKIERNGIEYEYIIRTLPRKVELNVSKFGSNPHFYGKLHYNSGDFVNLLNPNHSTMINESPYCGDTIELTQIVTKELNKLDSNRFEEFLIGYPTNGFLTFESVVERGKEMFDKHFDNGWVLLIKRFGKIIERYEKLEL